MIKKCEYHKNVCYFHGISRECNFKNTLAYLVIVHIGKLETLAHHKQQWMKFMKLETHTESLHSYNIWICTIFNQRKFKAKLMKTIKRKNHQGFNNANFGVTAYQRTEKSASQCAQFATILPSPWLFCIWEFFLRLEISGWPYCQIRLD